MNGRYRLLGGKRIGDCGLHVPRRPNFSGFKTLASLVVVAVIAAGGVLASRPASADAPVTPPDSCFAFSAGTITDYYNNEGNNVANPACPKAIAIPAAIGGVAVTSIGDWAFQNNQLTSVTIPGSVTSIGDFAFSRNQLTSLTIPSSLTSIGSYAFSSNQLTSVTIPGSVTSIWNSAFANNQLTSVTIPGSVTSIGNSAFYNNQLKSVVIPNSVTSIGDWAFYDNQLSSVSLSDGLEAIGRGAFTGNKLTNVVLPASLQALGPIAFFGQNPWGGVVDRSTDPAHDLWSSDPSAVQSVYDSIWYVRLYTADPSDPQDFTDSIMSEEWDAGADDNANGTTRDSLGGQIINPASVSLKYVDSHGNQLQLPQELTGVKASDGSALTDYSAKASAILAPLDPTAPTAQETTDMQAGFAQYYRAGQTKTFTAPAIAGYGTPTARTLTLAPGENVVTFVYESDGAADTEAGASGRLADTGTDVVPWIVGSAAAIAAGAGALFALRRRD